ncbi:proline-rich extensin-like protein EPR1 isoform X2 [Oncorhynchus mykiss]|uniref:proline-rich extensin-like protein EPR1 isoform X2 n=1 Tax=Oncorhynchus mykiss TaxID=8022 RepID=UPI0018784BFF|nr:proline-rich extensin-like protein EPR1 isoform X2 [Oncorhynchus mykiss]
METSVPQARTTLPPPSLLDYFAPPTTQRCQRSQDFFPPPPVEPIVVEEPICSVEAESLQSFEGALQLRKNKPLKGLTQRHKKSKTDMETSVPQARTTLPPPSLLDYFAPPTTQRCQRALDFLPPPPVDPIVVEEPISPPANPIVDELPIFPPVKPVVVELPISPPVKPIMGELPISPPMKHVMFELPIAPVEAESLQRFEGLTQRHKKSKTDMETSVPQARTTLPPPSLLDYFAPPTTQRCQRALDFLPPPPVDPIVVEEPISPPANPIVDELPIFPPVKPVVVELPISPPVKPIMGELPISPPMKHVMFELPIAPVEAESLQRFEGLTQRHKKSKTDMETSVPQARTTLPPPSLLDYFAPPTTQRCQRSQDFFPPPPVEPIVVEEPICSVEAESLQSFEGALQLRKNKPLKGLTQRHKKIQKDMETSVPQARTTLPPPSLLDYFAPPTTQRCQRALDFLPPPPVKPVVVELPISPPVKPIMGELPISPPMKHVMFELPIAPVEAESLQRFEGLTQRHKKSKTDMETSVPQARTTLPPPSLLDYFAPPTTQRCQRSQDFFPPPPVEPIVVEEPICSVEAESLQSFEGALQLRKNKPLKGLTQRHKKIQKDMETSVPQARTTLPPPSLLDYFAPPTTQRCQRALDFLPPPPVKPVVVELPISPPVKPIMGELPISPPMKHVMFELPIAPVEAESLQRFEGLTQRHKKRKTDMETSVPQARTTLPPPSLLDYFAPPTTQRCQRSQDFFPPPPVEPIVVEEPICSVEAESLQSFEGCQMAQHGVNPYSMRAGAPMSKYPGYPCTTTKAGPGISDASLVHMLRPLSPMLVPEDDGGWDSAGDHMSTPGTPFYMG